MPRVLLAGLIRDRILQGGVSDVAQPLTAWGRLRMQLIMTVESEEPAGTELLVGMEEKAGHRS